MTAHHLLEMARQPELETTLWILLIPTPNFSPTLSLQPVKGEGGDYATTKFTP